MSEETSQYSTYLPSATIENVPELLTEFDRGYESMHQSVPQLEHFHRTYGNVTDKVLAKTREPGYFDDPDLVLMNMPNFGNFYFRAVRSYLLGNSEDVSKIWQPTIYHPKVKSGQASAAIKLAMGVNSHVSYDLGLSVEEIGFKPEYERDYEKVNDSIRQTIDEILDEYVSVPTRLRGHVVEGVTDGVARWRDQAWSLARRLHESQDDEPARQRIEREAARVTMRRHWMLLHGGDTALKAFRFSDSLINKRPIRSLKQA